MAQAPATPPPAAPAPPPAPETPPTEASAKKSGGLVGKLLGPLAIVLIAGGEIGAAWFMTPALPAAAAEGDEDGADDETAPAEHAAPAANDHGGHGDAHGDAHGGGHGGGHGAATEPPVPADPDAIMEVDLGAFHIQSFKPISNTTQFLDFHIYATMRAGDKGEFDSRKSLHMHRLRDQVIAIVRSAETEDLDDPGLGLIKRRVLKKSNDLLGKPLLTGIIVSEFTFLEQ